MVVYIIYKINKENRDIDIDISNITLNYNNKIKILQNKFGATAVVDYDKYKFDILQSFKLNKNITENSYKYELMKIIINERKQYYINSYLLN